MRERDHLNAYGLEEPLIDTADSWNLPDGKVVHERLDRLRLEVKFKLPIRLILYGHVSYLNTNAGSER